jgi:hypothetical protein
MNRAFHHFVVRPWPVWLMLIGISVAVTIGAFFGNTSYERAAWAATLLEIAGLGKVALDLHRVRKEYARPSVVDEITAWFRELPSVFRGPKGRTIAVGAGEMVVVGSRIGVSVKAGPNSTLERRVQILEEELERVRDHMAAEHHDLVVKVDKIEASVATERNERTQGQHALQQKVADLAVGGLHLELVGLVWLFVGVALSTLPERIVTTIWEHGATILGVL